MGLSETDAIPSSLRERRQWVHYRIEQRQGKPTKVPYQPSGERASTTDPTSWSPFESVARATGFDGVGYVFSEDDPFVGIDLDGMTEDKPFVSYLIAVFDSYTERSPSGNGLHIWIRGEKTTTSCRQGSVEVYSHARYFTVTGDLVGSNRGIERRDVPLRAFEQHVFGLNKEKRTECELRVGRLFSGDFSDYPSQSEADLALCGMIVRWVGDDPAEIDRVFRQSGLYREKWERDDYRDRTIEKAISADEHLTQITQAERKPKTFALAKNAPDRPESDVQAHNNANNANLSTSKERERSRKEKLIQAADQRSAGFG